MDLLGLSDAEVFGTFEKIHGSKRGIERLEGSLGERRKELGERSTMTNVLKEMLGGGIAAEKSIPTSRGELAELIRADEASLAELKAGVNSLLQGEGNWNLSKVSEELLSKMEWCLFGKILFAMCCLSWLNNVIFCQIWNIMLLLCWVVKSIKSQRSCKAPRKKWKEWSIP